MTGDRNASLLADAPDLIAEALTEQYGERCPDFEPKCYCCKAWADIVGWMPLPPPPQTGGSDE